MMSYVYLGQSDNKKNVLTVVLSNTKADADGTPYGAIVLNLDANTVQAYFDDISGKDYNLMAFDRHFQPKYQIKQYPI